MSQYQSPPFQINPKILQLTAAIQEMVGEFKAYVGQTPSIKLRRENKIQTVHHSLAIEGNDLTEQQITAILENKRVIGPKLQILEVQNALTLYNNLLDFNAVKEKDFLKAHNILMHGLIANPGKYRSTAVGILKGTQVSHRAPPAKLVPALMGHLFHFLIKEKSIPWLIKACVFHYELEFIHPFTDGNGRMGRLWQQLILMKQSAVFEFISTETMIHQRQQEYYEILEKCDKQGDSTLFIEFSLENILAGLQKFNESYRPSKLQWFDRISSAINHFSPKDFSRKDYLLLHKGLSTATASRDLQQACLQKLLIRKGDQSQARYSQNKQKNMQTDRDTK